MPTGQQVSDRLPIPGSVKNTANTLAALNVAIDEAWPSIKITEYVPNAGTLASGTFEYSLSLSPAPHQDLGIARVSINEYTDQPEVLHSRVRQRYDDSTGLWVLIFSPEIVGKFAGKTFNVFYQRPQAEVAALSDSIKLPLAYLVSSVTYWYAIQMYAEQNTDSGRWREILVSSERQWTRSLRRNQSPQIGPVPRSGSERTPL